jgi:hypothetical protein
MFEDGIPAVQPDEERRTIRAMDIAELLEVSVRVASAPLGNGRGEEAVEAAPPVS